MVLREWGVLFVRLRAKRVLWAQPILVSPFPKWRGKSRVQLGLSSGSLEELIRPPADANWTLEEEKGSMKATMH